MRLAHGARGVLPIASGASCPWRLGKSRLTSSSVTIRPAGPPSWVQVMSVFEVCHSLLCMALHLTLLVHLQQLASTDAERAHGSCHDRSAYF